MRTVIIGNSGSGKTWLSHQLVDERLIAAISLDDIFWEPGGFDLRRPAADVVSLIGEHLQQPGWIVEGVFCELAEPFLEASYEPGTIRRWAGQAAVLGRGLLRTRRSLLTRGSQGSVLKVLKSEILSFNGAGRSRLPGEPSYSMSDFAEFQVRQLAAADAEAFSALRREVTADNPIAMGLTMDEELSRSIEDFRTQLSFPEPNAAFGAFLNGRLVGSAAVAWPSKFSSSGHKVDLWGVFVSPHLRRGGIGRALVEKAVAHAGAHGARRVNLTVYV